jgi:hypothetical protein
MLGARCNHGCFGDVNIAIVRELLAVLLFADVDNERYGGIDALVESLEVFVKVRLVDVAVSVLDMVDDVLDFDAVESFDGIVQFGIVDAVDGFSCEINGNASDV